MNINAKILSKLLLNQIQANIYHYQLVFSPEMQDWETSDMWAIPINKGDLQEAYSQHQLRWG